MIIAISGKKQSGKDTVGKIIQYLTTRASMQLTTPISANDYHDFLKNNHNLRANWKIAKFAKTLKECIYVITNIPLEDLEKEEVKNRVLFTRWFICHYKMRNNKNPTGRVSEYFATENEAKEALRLRSKTFLYGCDIDSQVVTVRILLQDLGTKVGRSIYSNLWIWSLFKWYEAQTRTTVVCDFKDGDYIIPEGHGEHSGTICSNPLAQYDHEPKYPNWIITDVRFPNELQACKEKEAITIRVNREGVMQDNHISETALDNATFDYYLNNTTIEQLIKDVETILKMEELL